MSAKVEDADSAKHRQLFTNNVLHFGNVDIRFADISPWYPDPTKRRPNFEVVLILHPMMFGGVDTWNRTPSMDWTVVDELLSKGFRVIAPDFRGHGQSLKPRDGYAYGKALISDQLKLLDLVECEKVHIAGYSLGAEVALKFAIQHPERVKSLVLGGSAWADAEQAESYQHLGDGGCFAGNDYWWCAHYWTTCCWGYRINSRGYEAKVSSRKCPLRAKKKTNKNENDAARSALCYCCGYAARSALCTALCITLCTDRCTPAPTAPPPAPPPAPPANLTLSALRTLAARGA
jgi:hypothetical protein